MGGAIGHELQGRAHHTDRRGVRTRVFVARSLAEVLPEQLVRAVHQFYGRSQRHLKISATLADTSLVTVDHNPQPAGTGPAGVGGTADVERITATILSAVERQLTKYFTAMSHQAEAARMASEQRSTELRAEMAQAMSTALERFPAIESLIESQRVANEHYQQALQAGCVLTHDSLEGLAAMAGVDAQGLAQTLAHVAQMSQGQAHDALGRQRFVRALSSPFKASWVTGALSHTQGGLLTRPDGAVLHQSGQVMPGVFAVGGCAAGLSGRGAEGY
eukprot:gene26324-47604_t